MGLEALVHGTTAALALLNDQVKGGIMACVTKLVVCQVPLSQFEDEGMIAAVKSGQYIQTLKIGSYDSHLFC